MLVIQDAVKYVPSHIIPGIFGLLSVSVYTRILTPEDYAFYALVLTTVTFLSNIGFGWLNYSVFRFFDEMKDEAETLISNSFIIMLMQFFLMILFGIALILLSKIVEVQSDLVEISIMGIMLTIAKVIFDQLLILLRAQRLAMQYSILRSLDSILKLLLSIILIQWFGFTYDGILYALVITWMFLSGFEIIHMSLWLRIRLGSFSISLLKKFFKYGFPLLGAGMTGTILSLADRYILTYFCSYHEVGLYAAGYRFAEMLIDVPGAILLMAYTPVLINKYNKVGAAGIREDLTKIYSMLFIFLVPAAIGAVFLSKEITGLFLGKAFYNAHSIFIWICPGTLAMCLTHVYFRTFELTQKTKRILYISASSAGINIILNIILIPVLGYPGAAVATFIAYCVQLFSSMAWSRSLIAFPVPVRSLFTSLCGSLVMCLFIHFSMKLLPGPDWAILPAQIGIGIVAYFLFLFTVKEPTLLRILAFSKPAALKQDR